MFSGDYLTKAHRNQILNGRLPKRVREKVCLTKMT